MMVEKPPFLMFSFGYVSLSLAVGHAQCPGLGYSMTWVGLCFSYLFQGTEVQLSISKTTETTADDGPGGRASCLFTCSPQAINSIC